MRQWILLLLLTGAANGLTAQGEQQMYPDVIRTVLEVTAPLEATRGQRLPLFTRATSDPGVLSAAAAADLVHQLDRRGIGVICSWWPDQPERTLDQGLPIARAQREQGVSVNINATSCLYSFFNGDPNTAHIDDQGKPFFDPSLWRAEMGCPFTLHQRQGAIRQRIERFADDYQREGLSIGWAWADWEIDGPLEVNQAHTYARRCQRCRAHIPQVDQFPVFQQAMRTLRSYLQFYAYTEPLLRRFPEALVGNYAVYPHDGYRYWLDFFERDEILAAHPSITDQGATYRQWADDFPGTGYTYGMPVVYTWYRTFNWYNFDEPDYRWFYNMLLIASNAGKSTPAQIPLVSFVSWHTTAPPSQPDPQVKQMSRHAYQELLWHMLLRGTDTFFVWYDRDTEARDEIQLAHQVYAAAQQYGAFLERGMPVCFAVPSQPGAVVSGLVLGDRLLVRRTDFGAVSEPVEILIGSRMVRIDPAPGQCRIIDL